MFISLCPVSDVKNNIDAAVVLRALPQRISSAKPIAELHPSNLCDGGWS